MLESLESRRLFAYTFIGGVLDVTGTVVNDAIHLGNGPGGSVVLNDNGAMAGFAPGSVLLVVAHGGTGDDVIAATPGFGVPVTFFGEAGDDNLAGGEASDLLSGGPGNDIIHGRYGNDLAYGDDGSDFVAGDSGNDELHGGIGNDTLFGEAGNDLLFGEAGNDVLHGSAGNDTLNGGAGVDALFGEDGNDVLDAVDGTADAVLDGGPGVDVKLRDALDP